MQKRRNKKARKARKSMEPLKKKDSKQMETQRMWISTGNRLMRMR
jgi:hypothetical protein